MFSKYYIKLFLFSLILLLSALIIDAKREELSLSVYLREDITLKEDDYINNEYLIYVSDLNQMIFPLNIIAKENNEFILDYYQDKINNSIDKQIYMKFSLLTNYSNYLPMGVKTYIAPSSRLVNYELDEGLLTLNFSKEFLYYNHLYEEEMLKIITYTFSELSEVDEIKLLCENKNISFNRQIETLKKSNFSLNVFFNTADILNATPYTIYYVTAVQDAYYLVPTRIYDNETDTNAHIKILLINTFNIPLLTLIEEDNIDEIIKNEYFQEKLPYYQYYLSCFENNIREKQITIDIKNVNFYELEFE